MREAENPTIELLDPGRLEVDVYTFDVTLHLPNEELLNGTLCFCALWWPLTPVQDPASAISHLHLHL